MDDATQLQEFGKRYTAAWCSQNAASVAAFFTEGGALTINAGVPAVGRVAIAAAAQGFMTAFPDMVVAMDGVSGEGDHAVYRWTLTGTNTGPGGTGKSVCIRGHEEWTIGADLLIADSKGHFDEAEYNRQLNPPGLGNPLTGTWIANLEKSRRHANHQFRSATLTIAVNGEAVSLRHAGVNMAGKEESGTTELRADGKEHPVSPQAPGVMVAAWWASARVLETEARKDGQVVGRGTYAASDDGKSLSATVAGTDAAGAAFEQVIVFDRA